PVAKSYYGSKIPGVPYPIQCKAQTFNCRRMRFRDFKNPKGNLGCFKQAYLFEVGICDDDCFGGRSCKLGICSIQGVKLKTGVEKFRNTFDALCDKQPEAGPVFFLRKTCY